MKAMNLFKSLKPCAWMPVALLLAGCGGTQYASDPVNPAQPFAFPGQSAPPYAGPSQAPLAAPSPALPQAPVPYTDVAVNPNAMSTRLSSGELIKLTFSDIPNPPAPMEVRIPEDGRITLPYSMTVYAIGKTVSQLQDEIRSMYVPKMYVRLTVNIKTEDRVYFVGGEVRSPARQAYLSDITVLRAIDTVGGFTDFANRRRIELRRANGEVHYINWDKARRDPKLDLKVYPNDQIIVHRRIVF
jgi:protein involved in polysaccharide export with SLBB domain